MLTCNTSTFHCKEMTSLTGLAGKHKRRLRGTSPGAAAAPATA